MAGSRNTQTKRKNTKSASGRRQTRAVEEPGFIRSEIVIILTFAVSILLLLSNFHQCGILGDFLRGVMLGLFGWLGIFVMPIFFCAAVCLLTANRGNDRLAWKVTAVGVCLWILCGMFQMVTGFAPAQDHGLFGFYQASSKDGSGGGLFGAALAWSLSTVLGNVGTWLILLVVLAIGVVFITEKSIVKMVQKSGNKAYQYAKEDLDRRRVLHEERKEEKRRLREEQVVRGVNLASTTIAMPTHLPGMEDVQGDGLRTPNMPGNADAAADIDQAIDRLSGQGYDNRISEDGPDFLGPNVFSGSIQYPHDYETDDSVPFAMDCGEGGPDHVPDVFEAAAPMAADTFEIPEEAKRVVTASGKVIETDTEALQKKLEAKKAQRIEDGDLTVREEIAQKEEKAKREYIFPSLELLTKPKRPKGKFADNEYKATAIKLQQTLQNFGVGVTVTNISCGPSVTRYELHPEQGVKVSKIVGLADDIKLNLAAADIRIEAPIPGKAAVGIEVPNKENNTVFLRELLESESFQTHGSTLAFAVGKDIGGQVVVTDIAKMPHLLIAGSTGSGKSVCINTLIMSLIFKSSPEDVKLIMVDPKVVELSVYNGIPHLLIPVVTDPKKASGALNWAVAEMTDRYQKFAEYNVRDLKGYNEKIKSIENIEDDGKPQKLPQIVIIVDELADLMMVAPGEVEDAICRLAQLARAAGIHLVIATQRPSVNVITGLIKANVPSRVAFAVSSGVDSRTIIDMNGAEKLLGKGDMLFYPSGFPKPQRVQGAFVSDQEVQKVVEFLTEQGMEPAYNPEIESRLSAPPAAEASGASDGRDEYFLQAGRFIIEKEKASIGMLQRMFKIGFNRAARIMDQLAEAGVVGEEEGTKPRKVLMTMEEFDSGIVHGQNE